MPLALEPDQTIEVCLKCDEAKPAEAQELAARVMEQNFTPADKKKFGSPSACGSGPSANSPARPPVSNAGLNWPPATALRSNVPAAVDPVAPSALLEESNIPPAPPPW